MYLNYVSSAHFVNLCTELNLKTSSCVSQYHQHPTCTHTTLMIGFPTEGGFNYYCEPSVDFLSRLLYKLTTNLRD